MFFTDSINVGIRTGGGSKTHAGVGLDKSEINNGSIQTPVCVRPSSVSVMCKSVLEFSRGPCRSGKRTPMRISPTETHRGFSCPAANHDLYTSLSSLVNIAEHI